MQHRFGRPIAVAKVAGVQPRLHSPRSLVSPMANEPGRAKPPPTLPLHQACGAISARAVEPKWPISLLDFLTRSTSTQQPWASRTAFIQKTMVTLTSNCPGFTSAMGIPENGPDPRNWLI
jgi:hypothetical protein